MPSNAKDEHKRGERQLFAPSHLSSPFGLQAEGCELINWKSALVPVIPAEAGIQAVFELELKTKPGCRREFILSPIEGPA
jgi:hypothetical protein